MNTTNKLTDKFIGYLWHSLSWLFSTMNLITLKSVIINITRMNYNTSLSIIHWHVNYNINHRNDKIWKSPFELVKKNTLHSKPVYIYKSEHNESYVNRSSRPRCIFVVLGERVLNLRVLQGPPQPILHAWPNVDQWVNLSPAPMHCRYKSLGRCSPTGPRPGLCSVHCPRSLSRLTNGDGLSGKSLCRKFSETRALLPVLGSLWATSRSGLRIKKLSDETTREMPSRKVRK